MSVLANEYAAIEHRVRQSLAAAASGDAAGKSQGDGSAPRASDDASENEYAPIISSSAADASKMRRKMHQDTVDRLIGADDANERLRKTMRTGRLGALRNAYYRPAKLRAQALFQGCRRSSAARLAHALRDRASAATREAFPARTVYLNSHVSTPALPPNVIKNTKYNLVTFIPKILYEQFKFFFNLYFLLITITQFFPPLKVGFLFTYVAPLALVLGVTAVKEGVDDLKRLVRDRRINGEVFQRIVLPTFAGLGSAAEAGAGAATGAGARRPGATLAAQPVRAADIRIGDILILRPHERVPADCVLLHVANQPFTEDLALPPPPGDLTRSREDPAELYLKTDQLDGETDWKLRKPCLFSQRAGPRFLADPSARALVDIEPAHKDVYAFSGRAIWVVDGEQRSEPLSLDNTVWASTVIASPNYTYALVVYTGRETKARMNANKPRVKSGIFDRQIDNKAMLLFWAQLLLSLGYAALSGASPASLVFWFAAFRFLLLFSQIIPISLRVNLDIGKIIYSLQISADTRSMGHPIARTTNLAEQLGRIGYICSDKTGTITQNRMIFRSLHSGRRLYDNKGVAEADAIRADLLAYYRSSGAAAPHAPDGADELATEYKTRRLLSPHTALAPAAAEAAGGAEGDPLLPNPLLDGSFSSVAASACSRRAVVRRTLRGNAQFSVNGQGAEASDGHAPDGGAAGPAGGPRVSKQQLAVLSSLHDAVLAMALCNTVTPIVEDPADASARRSAGADTSADTGAGTARQPGQRGFLATLRRVMALFRRASTPEKTRLPDGGAPEPVCRPRPRARASHVSAARQVDSAHREYLYGSYDNDSFENPLKVSSQTNLNMAVENPLSERVHALDDDAVGGLGAAAGAGAGADADSDDDAVITIRAADLPPGAAAPGAPGAPGADTRITLQASSPDEVSLVKFASALGLHLVARDRTTIRLLNPLGQSEAYTVLYTFPFSSVTKRMAIVLRSQQTDEAVLYVKGADNVMLAMASLGVGGASGGGTGTGSAGSGGGATGWVSEQVLAMSSKGLRTLVFGARVLAEDELAGFAAAYKVAAESMEGREQRMQECEDSLLHSIGLLAVSGVEDLLQDQVKVTIQQIRAASIRFFLLTGDKIETSKNIARSTYLISPSQEFFEISHSGYRDCVEGRGAAGAGERGGIAVAPIASLAPGAPGEPGASGAAGTSASAAASKWDLSSAFPFRDYIDQRLDRLLETGCKAVPIVDGTTLSVITAELSPDILREFLSAADGADASGGTGGTGGGAAGRTTRGGRVLAVLRTLLCIPKLQTCLKSLRGCASRRNRSERLGPLPYKFISTVAACSSFICSRTSPEQKAIITKMLSNLHTDTVCTDMACRCCKPKVGVAAIGDGGNDVSMIQSASVGIGLVGKEGQQASLAADYSVDRFKDLRHLLLWHGRNSYMRASAMSQFVMARGIIMVVIQAIFAACFYFASVPLFTGWLLIGYSVVYTALPVVAICLDRDVLRTHVFHYPELYLDGLLNRRCNFKTLMVWNCISLWEGCVVINLSKLVIMNGNFYNIVGVCFTCLVCVELLSMGFTIHEWTRTMLVAEAVSVGLYVASIFLLRDVFDYRLILNWLFWAKCLGVVAIAVLPVFFIRFMKTKISPSTSEKIRGEWRKDRCARRRCRRARSALEAQRDARRGKDAGLLESFHREEEAGSAEVPVEMR